MDRETFLINRRSIQQRMEEKRQGLERLPSVSLPSLLVPLITTVVGRLIATNKATLLGALLTSTSLRFVGSRLSERVAGLFTKSKAKSIF